MVIYTRVYSGNSPRQLVSSKGLVQLSSRRTRPPISAEQLLAEFKNHVNRWGLKPTALVSVSTRIIDTLNRAFGLWKIDGDHASDIWIAFIDVPDDDSVMNGRIHNAKQLALEIGDPDWELLHYERVFEWDIPQKYILHKVSLQTLFNRGLDKRDFLGPAGKYIRTKKMRNHVAHMLNINSLNNTDCWAIGRILGSFARLFGARAPTWWIAWKLIGDCHDRPQEIDPWAWKELEDGIDTVVVDSWLADLPFFNSLKHFEACRHMMGDEEAEERAVEIGL